MTDSSAVSPGSSAQLLLLRLAAEVTTKSNRTRNQFQKRLVRNLRDALDGTGAPYDLETEWSRIFVRTRANDAPSRLSRVFGLSSLSPVEAVVPARLDAIVEAGHQHYAARVSGKSFGVRTRRTGKHPFSSHDVNVKLGAALDRHGFVDLTSPEVLVNVEVRREQAYLFSEQIPGGGGLPLGVEGRAVALISGGFDSAVSAALMLKRGIELDYVFCNLGGDAYERAVLQVAKLLADEWSFGSRPRLFVVDFADAVAELRKQVKPGYLQVVLKRLMYRAASLIGLRENAEAIVTGEAIGQVSSQTLANLRAIEPAAELPVFRPLLGFDKTEIIERARKLGTAALSEQVKEYCAIAPGKPVTAATVSAVDREESRLDQGLIHRATTEPRVHDLRKLNPSDLVAPYLFIDRIPENARVLDCRPEDQYRRWHLPGAEHMEEWELLKNYRSLDRDPIYVLYCAHGIQTAHIAERMQQAGYEAYSFRGGLRRIMEQHES